MEKLTVILFLLGMLLLNGCDLSRSGEDDKEIKLTEKAAQLVEADNQFGFELFQNIYATEEKYENLMVSPLSVSLALAMTYNGTSGETKTAMEETLKLHGLTPEEINSSYQTLVNALKSLDSKVVLEIANAIFYREDFSVEQNFISTNRKYYNAEVSPLNFGSPNAVNTINDWVADKTHNKIEKILDNISSDHVMFLLNAVYFNGIWKSKFEKENTETGVFNPESGSAIQTSFMQQKNSVLYTSNDLFSAVELPYGQGNYNMYVFLPQANRTLMEIIEKLDKTNWESWMESFTKTNVDLKFPKFKYAYEIKLNDVLSEMGMGIAFSGMADFTGINKGGGLKIDYVKHKSFIDVKEEGTEAAAVTVVAIELTSAGGGQSYIPFYANKPFLFAITEKSTGAILFIGTVKNPTYE